VNTPRHAIAKSLIIALLLALAPLLAPLAGLSPRAPVAHAATPVNLIIDTDIECDVDDVGALALANALADNGEANILGVMVNTSSPWGAPAVNAVMTYYGRPDVPIGQYKVAGFDPTCTGVNGYPQYLAQHFPNKLRSGANAPDATALYRQILAAQPDGSVVIASIGFMPNLANLLNSAPDGYSSLNGRDLVTRKVRTLTIMCGTFPSGTDGFNLYYDKPDAATVINTWPTKIVFSQVGGNIGTGPASQRRHPAPTPCGRPTRSSLGSA